MNKTLIQTEKSLLHKIVYIQYVKEIRFLTKTLLLKAKT